MTWLDGSSHRTAVVGTNTQHTANDLMFMVRHRERIVDWGYRSIRAVTKFVSLAIRNPEGHLADHSYCNGCSNRAGQSLPSWIQQAGSW